MVRTGRLIALGAAIVACDGGTITETPIEWLAPDGSIRLEEDGTASIVLAAEVNRSDVTVSYQIVSQPGLGQLVGSGALWQYVPDENANGTDSFQWQASANDTEKSDIATITVYIDPVNDAPRGQGSQLVTGEDTPGTGTLPASDVEGDTLTYSLVQAPTSGRVDIGSDGTYTYTPDRNYVGTDTFLWAATDDSNASTGPVRVDINVAEENDPPTISDIGYVGPEDTQLRGTLFGEDPDGDSLTWLPQRQPTFGTLQLNTNFGTFTYTPNPNYFGSDSFDVVANDGFVNSATKTINITITSVNDRPLVTPAALLTDEDTALTASVVATDVEGEPLSYRVSEPPTRGIVALDATTGSFTYTPNANVNGIDSFTVIASDPTSDSLPGRITVDVRPVNDVPRLQGPGLLVTDEDMLATGSITGTDPEGDTLIFSVDATPTNGSVVVSPATGAVAYTPNPDFNGADQFSVIATDGQGTSPPTLVDVLVRPINDPPIPNASSLTTITGAPATTTLSATDPEGDDMFFLIVQQPGHGTAVVDTASGEVTYTPEAGYTGTDVLVWQVTDGELSTNSVLPISISLDSDGDGFGDAVDNCPDVANADQGDVGGNGIGDVCDCYYETFDATLDADFWASQSSLNLLDDPVTSPTYAARLTGAGSYAQTVALPGCTSFYYSVQVAAGPPPPEITDALALMVRKDGGTWETVFEMFGTGNPESYQLMEGHTSDVGLDLSGGDVEFRFEVIADEPADAFFLDDVQIACDEDSDFLPDCIEATLPGYDLTQADADGDGLNDYEEYLLGTSPFDADTDLDGVLDPDDNCPLDPNPLQENADGDEYGDACEPLLPCADEILDSLTSITVSGSTVNMGNDWTPGCGASNSNDYAYQYTVPQTGTYAFDTFGSSYDTVIAVYEGFCFGAPLACNDDSGSLQSRVTLALNAGDIVIIGVDGYSTNQGSYVLNVNLQ